MKQSKVTAVILTYNNDALCDRVVDCFIKHSPQVNLLVVDNGGDIPYINKSCEVLRLPHNCLIGSAFNQGFDVAAKTSDYIYMVTNDIYFDTDVVGKLTHWLNEFPRYAIIGPRIVKPDGTSDVCGTKMDFFGVSRNLHHPTVHYEPQIKNVFCVIGCAMLIRVKALKDTGLITYCSYKNYYEETDLCHRAWLTGWKVAYCDCAGTITHLGGATIKKTERSDYMVEHFITNMIASGLSLYGLKQLLLFIPACLGYLTVTSLFRRSSRRVFVNLLNLSDRILLKRRNWKLRRKLSDREVRKQMNEIADMLK